jgi:hypothetical protein
MAAENNKSPANKDTQARPKTTPEKVVSQPYNIEKMKAAGATAMAGFIFAVAQYKKSLAILMLNVGVLGLMSYQTYYISTYNPPVKYIPIYEDSTIIDPIPLTAAFKTEGEMSQWLADVSKDVFSYGYLDADAHGEKIKKYFTEKGFTDYFNGFKNSPDLSRVKNKKLEVLSSVLGAPSKVSSGVSKGNFAYWEYTFTVRQVFVSTTEGVIPVTYNMVATIVRQDQRLYRDGIAIHSLRVESSSNIK